MLVQRTKLGTWCLCKKQSCENIFFRHPYGHKCFSLSDKIGICPLCIFEIRVKNQTLPKRTGNISDYTTYKHSSSKPENDTL